jgi:hypothetical protein
MTVTREVSQSDWRVRLDLSNQVLRLEIPEFILGYGKEGELLPTLPADGGPVSAAALLMKAKQVDDGLYAAVELAAQQGLGRHPGKASLLKSLAATLADSTSPSQVAAVAILAACKLGSLPVPVSDPLQEPVEAAVSAFLRDELLSKPLGFYTWTPELSVIFRQDRLLQQLLDPGPADALAHAVERTEGAAEAYRACLRLNARLTNPPAGAGLSGAGRRAFLPASRSHEQVLIERLFGDKPAPEGFDLMTEVIRRVRSGEVNLEPTDSSGWYDHQTFSLEPLVVPDRMPESGRLELGKRYRRHLDDLFRGALALARETHAKQAGGGRGGYCGSRERPIWVNPDLTVEPLPTLYARRAETYRFVRSVLEEAFGGETLDRLPRLTPEGAVAGGLGEELAWLERLFVGAAATACRELGMPSPEGSEAALQCFASWRVALGKDRDVSRDARMMVPVFYDIQRKRLMVWAFLGWRTTAVDVAYRRDPIVLAVESSQPAGKPPPVYFCGAHHKSAVPVMAEVYVTRLLDRDAFRRHCDRHRTREAILANLR